jgi:hypothetical protein
MALQPSGPGGAVERAGAGTLSDVITTILDKGLVIDVYARVALVGIEVLQVDVRIVVASVDTYLRFAEAANRVQLGTSEPAGLPDMIEDVQSGGAKPRTKGALDAVSDKLNEWLDSDAQDHEVVERERPRRKRTTTRS